MPRPRFFGVLLILTGLGALPCSAQLLSNVVAAKFADVVQTSATEQDPGGYEFAVYATVAGTVPTTTVVALQSPTGTKLRLSNEGKGIFVNQQAFATKADMEAAYPDGTYTITVTIDGTTTPTTFSFSSGTGTPPTLITDYDALQGAPTTTPPISWTPITGATSQDFLSLQIVRSDGTSVYTSPDTLAANATGVTPLLVNGTPLMGYLSFAKLTVTPPPTAAGANVATGSGFNLEFQLSCNVQAPLIWRQPAGAALVLNGNYALEVTATGWDPKYQWYKDGAAIPNATSDAYEIIGAQASNAGTYTVAVTNPGGTAVSDPAAISVAPAKPVIQVQPESTAVQAGTAVNLSVTAYGTHTYQWYKDGVAVAGETAPTLAIADAALSDAGIYTVQVSDATASTVSAPAALGVGPSVYVSTEAGTGVKGVVDGPAATAQFEDPRGIAVDAAGNLYVADGAAAVIRKISAAGIVSTFAGVAGQPGAVDGPATTARFHYPFGLTIDAEGNLYVSDGNAIRKITPAGMVSTLAGDVTEHGAVDGRGTMARFYTPVGLAVDTQGEVYVADSANDTVRKITPDGTVSTVAGLAGYYATVDGVGSAARFATPTAVTVDGKGNVWVAEGGGAIRRIAPSGSVAAVVGITGATQQRVDGIGPNANLEGPVEAIAADTAHGVVYWTEGPYLRRVTADGIVQTIAGNYQGGYVDGIGSSAELNPSSGLTVGPSGELYLTDTTDRVRKITFDSGTANPAIGFSAQPVSHTLAVGSTFVLTAPTTGNVTFGSWEKDGAAIPGATTPELMISKASAADSGTYTFVAGNAAGYVTSQPALVNISSTATPGRLMNLSVRSAAGRASDTLLVGFAIAGGSGQKQVLTRGIGPTLATFGVAHPLPDPTLTMISAGTAIASNDNWSSATGSVFESVGAFGLPPGSADAAMTTALNPGTYSVEVGNKDHPGVAMAGIYDLDPVNAAGARLTNVSARTYVGTGDAVLIAGFSVLGDTSKTFLIRGAGPSLVQFGIGDELTDPRIDVRSGGTLVASNDNWGGGAELVQAFNQVGAFGFVDGSTRDAALLVTLKPGQYTVELSGVGQTTGVGLVEVYEMP